MEPLNPYHAELERRIRALNERRRYEIMAGEDRWCSDCGVKVSEGATIAHIPVSRSVVTSRTYCPECKVRRGLTYLFDPRSWAEIAAASCGDAA